MSTPLTFPPKFGTTRAALHRVAIHIVARARVEASGRFSLRVSPGGFGTPEFGPEPRRLRVSGGPLLVDSDAMGDASATVRAIDGATLATLAAVAGVDLDETLDVGHDTQPLGDRHELLHVDGASALALGEWFRSVALVLDDLAATMGDTATPTLTRLWPEHFDIAIEAVPRAGVRVNLGGSPGDGFCDEPYLYVGPWTDDRPGGDGYWNAPFGALITASDLGGDAASALGFFTEGTRRLATG